MPEEQLNGRDSLLKDLRNRVTENMDMNRDYTDEEIRELVKDAVFSRFRV